MNFLQKILLYQGGKVRYGTAGTTTTTTLASSGGLLINIDSATGDIARTTSGWIEDEKYGLWFWVFAGTTSGEFDTTVTRTGTKTLKVSNTNVTGISTVRTIGGTSLSLAFQKYGIPVKSSTKYKISCWVKTNNVATAGASLKIYEFNSAITNLTSYPTNTLTGTNDWTLCTLVFTTQATCVYLDVDFNNNIAGNISDAWFDINSMTLEEVVEPVANSLTSSSPSLVSVQAVGSTDNIDQSLDIGAAYANTYTPPTSISEAATALQTFVPTKSKLTRIGVYVVAKGTGNWTLTVHNAANAVQSSATIANASLTNSAFNYFNIPANVTAGATYHFHVTSTVADGTLKCNTANDLETCSYIENYYKPTTNFKASQNNSIVSISADEDGFLESGKINLTTGQYTFDIRNVTSTIGATYGHIFLSRTIGSGVEEFIYNTSLQYQIRTAGATNDGVLKIKIPGGITNPQIKAYLRRALIRYSTDNVSYTTMYDNTGSSTAYDMTYDIPGTITTLYIKIVSNSGFGGVCFFADSTHPFSIVGTVDVSSYSTLRNYPTNKDIIKQYSTTLGSATTSATYRATKWGFPAIEYGSDTNVDQSQLIFSGASAFGGYLGVNYITSQSFTTTKSSHTGVTLYKRANTGTPTGNVKFDVRTDNAGDPSTTILATYTMPLATYNALTVNADFTVNLPCNLTPGTKYHYVITDTATETGTNIFNLGVNSSGGYSGGDNRNSSDGGTTWVVDGTADIYFKTLYSTVEYQYLDVDTTATGSTVAFSELGTTYTTVADGASLAITSTSTPNLFVKANITANRLYVSSNDYVASSDKDGSLRQSIVYQVVQ